MDPLISQLSDVWFQPWFPPVTTTPYYNFHKSRLWKILQSVSAARFHHISVVSKSFVLRYDFNPTLNLTLHHLILQTEILQPYSTITLAPYERNPLRLTAY